jgi:exodeoxyribonuclease V alpha subunit
MIAKRVNSKPLLRKSAIYQQLRQYFTDANLQRIANYYRRDLRGLDSKADLVSGLFRMRNVLEENPYLLSEIPRITVLLVDSVVTDLPDDHPWHVGYAEKRRVDAMVKAVLASGISNGQAIMNESMVLDEAEKVVLSNTPDMNSEIENLKLVSELDKLIRESDVYEHVPGGIIDREYYENTNRLANMLIERSEIEPATVDEAKLKEAVKASAVPLSAEQQDVVRNLISSRVSLLTGYAGTGKSTLVQALTNYLQLTAQDAQLCAIAGKACFNLTQITHMPSRTIAGLVYAGVHLRVPYLIIDEISMVSEADLLKLLYLLSPKTHVVMIGDPAQLPAVEGVGMLTAFPDFLKSSVTQSIYTHTLTHVFRQGEGHLLDHATSLRAVEEPTDFSDDDTLKYRQVENRRFGLFAYQAAANKFGMDDVNLITPKNEDVDWFNEQLQRMFSKGKPVLRAHELQFFEGDKVLVTHNMYHAVLADSDKTANIFNGFVGRVKKVFDQGVHPRIRVEFKHVASSSRNLEFDFYVDDNNLPDTDGDSQYATIDNLSLGYALTVHKAQGSTIPVVIYYLKSGTSVRFLTRQLLYTALTRAEKLIFLTDQTVDDTLLSQYVHSDAYRDASSYLSIALSQAERAYLADHQESDDDDDNFVSEPLSDRKKSEIDDALEKLFGDK